jgi:hypothetical protein
MTRTARNVLFVATAIAAGFLASEIMPLFAQSPPVITNIQISSTTEDSAVITWTTDKNADSLVNFGKQPDYGMARVPGADKTEHTVNIENLDPSTLYHFRVSSADEFGNLSVSGDFTFVTEGIQVENIERVQTQQQQALVSQAVQAIQQITDPQAIEIVQEQVTQRAEEVIKPPVVIGRPNVIEIGQDFAVIAWVTDRPANSMVSYSTTQQYLATQTYNFTQGQQAEQVIEHQVRVTGLTPATEYHFIVSSEDSQGLKGESADYTFETKSRLPVIEDVQIIKLEEEAATIAWSTDVPAAGRITHQNLDTGELRTEGSPEFLSTHVVRIANLTLGTTYQAIIVAENEQGETVESEPLTFTTVRDEEGPIITQVTNESTLFPGAETRIQTIVSWVTDEPAFCQFFYHEGLATAVEPLSLPKNEDPKLDHVQVVIEFLPSTVYKFWIECDDLAENVGRSEDFVLFTPEQEKNIIDIILENFEGAFGWVRNIGG